MANRLRQAAALATAVGSAVRSASAPVASRIVGLASASWWRPSVSRAFLRDQLEAMRERADRSPGWKRRQDAAALVFGFALIGGAALVGLQLGRREAPAPYVGPLVGLQTASATGSETTVRPSERVAAATPTASPPPLPTAAPSPPPPDVTVALSRAWRHSFGLVEAHIVVEVLNTGPSRVRIRPSQSSYIVRADDGQAVAKGNFAYAFPPSIAPGERAYLIETAQVAFVSPEQVDRIEPEVEIVESTTQEPELEVSDLSWTDTPDGDTVSLTGTVSNPSRSQVTNGVVGVIFFDASGAVVGALYDNIQAGKLAPGETRTFHTRYPGTGPLDPESIASVRAFGFERQP